jgi:hypothetical protein
MMDIDQLIVILRRAHAMPHNSAADVFMTAGMMAETIEACVNGPSDNKKTETTRDKPPVLTVKRLRELGLDYPTVADCAHDLVVVKGMKHDAAAKRMGGTVQQVNAGLLNYKLRKKPDKEQTNSSK